LQEHIGRYEIRREIGRGGMATVYLAYDPRFKRQVAIKVLPRQFTHDPKYLARFEQEAQLIGTLEHRAIVPVYDFGEHNDAPYLVMRYMSGGSLRDRLRGKSLPLEAIAPVFNALAPALDYAHQSGIVHRDVKPANVFFDHEGFPYLADFGIARLAEVSQSTTGVIGTPAYMSPEQVINKKGQPIDGRADVYALGVMLYEMLTGRQPYEGETSTQQMMAHVLEPVPDVLEANPDLPPAAREVIQKVLAKEPDDRYSTAAELAQAVRELAQADSQPAGLAGEASQGQAQEAVVDAAEAGQVSEAIEDEDRADIAEAAAVSAVGAGQTGLEPIEEALPDAAGAAGVHKVLAENGGEGPPALPPSGWERAEGGFPRWVWLAGALAILAIAIISLQLFSGGQEGTEEPAADYEARPTVEEKAAGEGGEDGREESVPTAAAETLLKCDDAFGCIEVGPDESILLASALVLSGPNAELGIDSQRGMELALDFRGEVLGHGVELQTEDEGCSAEGGQTAASSIVSNPKIVAIVGTSCSDAAIPAVAILSEAGYSMVSPSTTSSMLTNPDQAWQPGYFRTAHNDLVQGGAMAEFAFRELGLNRAAVIHDGDPYTVGLAGTFAEAYENLGGEIVAFEAKEADATEVEDLLASIAAAGPQFLFYPVFTELGLLITNTARAMPEMEGVTLAAADGVQNPDFLQNTAGSSEGLFASGPDLNFPGPFYQEEFLPAYLEKYGTEPTGPFHAHAFDATNMILDAVEKVAQRQSDGTLLIGRQALREALAATKGMEGITGTISCGEYGDCADPQIAVSQVQEGQFVPIWSSEGGEIAAGDCRREDVFCIGVVTDVGEIDDRSFNQAAWEGAQMAASELGARVDYIETQDAIYYAENIAHFADNGFDVIVTAGFALGEATAEAAMQYPDVTFIGVEQNQDEVIDNLAGLIFDEEKAGFLAGVLAGYLTETGTVGQVLGSEQVPSIFAFKVGFDGGATYADPDINLITTYHPGDIPDAFIDPAWGAQTARETLQQGADVIFGAGGETGNGALIEVANQGGALCVGVDVDQWETVPEARPCLVTSAMKLIAPGVFDLIVLAYEDQLPGGNYFGRVGLAPFHDFEARISQDIKDELGALEDVINEGALDSGYERGG
jgi:basic membrane lipoprotein Med (substrate-binding protein (PBP1-ABC) superfamily)/ABC-type branched-subunit amino acid transport system substrate-binding protein